MFSFEGFLSLLTLKPVPDSVSHKVGFPKPSLCRVPCLGFLEGASFWKWMVPHWARTIDVQLELGALPEARLLETPEFPTLALWGGGLPLETGALNRFAEGTHCSRDPPLQLRDHPPQSNKRLFPLLCRKRSLVPRHSPSLRACHEFDCQAPGKSNANVWRATP